MTDIAALGFSVDSSELVRADAALDDMAASANSAGAAAANLGSRARAAGAQLANASNQARTFSTQMNKAAIQTSGLGAQFNDIGVTLAAGQSPLLIALQQGTQINQQLAQFGTGASRLRALGAAFTSVISPVNLLTIGVIAGSAALAQWAIQALSAGRETREFGDIVEDAEAAISSLAGTIDDIAADSFPSLTDAAQDFLRSLRELNSFAAQNEINILADDIANAFVSLDSLDNRGRDAFTARIRDTFADLTTNEVADFRAALESLEDAEGVNAQLNALNEVRDIIESASGGIDNMTAAQREFYEQVLQAGSAASDLQQTLFGTEAVMATLNDAADAVTDAFAAAVENAQALGARIESLSPAFDAAAISAGSLPGIVGDAARAAGLLLANLQAISGVGTDEPLFTPNDVRGGRGAPATASPLGQFAAQLNAENAARNVAGGGGGGGGGADEYQASLERLVEALRTEEETLSIWYQERRELLLDARAQELLGEEEHRQALERLEAEHQQRMAALQAEASNRRLGEFSSLFGALGAVAEAGGERMARAAAIFNGIQATTAAYAAAVDAMRDPSLGFVGKIAAFSSVLATGLGAVRAIRQAGSAVGAGGGASASATGGAGSAAPASITDQTVLVQLEGPDFLVDLADSILTEIYEQTAVGDRRVVIQRAS